MIGLVGVLHNVYAIRRQGSPSLASTVAALGKLLTGPVVHGPPTAPRDPGWLLSPETARSVYENEHLPFDRYPDARAAIHALPPTASGMVSFMVPARFIRREPEHFFDWPAWLGICHIPLGHRLVVGVTDAFEEDEEDPPPPRFEGTVHDLVWLHGKNAPLLDDFLGSSLHRALDAHWPQADYLADEWL